MTPHTYLEHGITVLQARLRTPRASHATATDVHPFITLSRETGAGGTSLGDALVPLLDRDFAGDEGSWVFLDRDLLQRALTQHRLPASLAEYLPEDRVSEIRATIGELVGLHPSLWQLEQKVSEAVLQLAHVGHVILAGRAAHLITRALPGGLHVRLVASRATRIERTAAALGCSFDAAAKHVDQNDDARRRFVRSNFDADIEDPHYYDVVINTEHFNPHDAAQLVVSALRERLHQAHAFTRHPTIAT